MRERTSMQMSPLHEDEIKDIGGSTFEDPHEVVTMLSTRQAQES